MALDSALGSTTVFLSVLFNSLGDSIKDAFTSAAKDPSFLAALRDPAVSAYSPESAGLVKGMASGQGARSRHDASQHGVRLHGSV